ncbi:tRNA lysidine(34) synthetase TilS [Desertibacillus haloalkaliphilus]|uniref:tRNA lysidine(34) synthetase TilS n=1 Tax=Desertibacillus haloalkaliphilus TaxID=1328930 RepID=UPI001C27A6EB|nr:tRNA lysidine(34) synthetase TilS [Desertibacillus haloalkaliphilus]MBU8908447.1 tRNA lysidine(34) synthetase TilS [Desertibacillus haloalkaliphilus]
MKQAVKHFIERHALLRSKATVVVGVSGGPDSMALLHYLSKEQEQLHLTIVAAHVDHMFRKQQSYEDYKYVENYCLKQGISFRGARIDVKAYQEQTKVSAQMAARECRYAFFDEVMKEFQADYLALAHHGDDQIETMVMKQVRGSFGIGLAGIPVRRPFSCGEIIRPFLGITKAQIEHYCKEVSLKPRQDPTNDTATYVRNRFRQQLLPFLKAENPNVHEQFQKQSEWTTDEQRLLQQMAENVACEAIVEKSHDIVIFSIKQLEQVAIPLQRRVIHLILSYLYGKNSPSISMIHIEEILMLLMQSHPSGTLNLPLGLHIRKSYDTCTASFLKDEMNVPFSFRLTLPGMIETRLGKISGEVTSIPPTAGGNSLFFCDKELVHYPLTVRSRRPGDRISIKGMNGSKKIKDLFIDHKINRKDREIWPLVVDSKDQILWVPMLSKSSLAVPSDHTKTYLSLRFEPASGY